MKTKFFIAAMLLLFALPAFAESKKSPEWISELKAAQNTEQLVIVQGTKGSNAKFSFHERDNDSGEWYEIISCNAFIGKNGWGKTREGDMKTPEGVYTFTKAFGILEDPGCPMGYTKVDDSHYWVGDSNSERYNQFVSTNDYDDFNRKESEHIIDYTLAYKYCLNISYNLDGTPKKGSAIFLHCQTRNKFTAGCVAIPDSYMREVIRHVKEDCVVVMYSGNNIKKY